MLGKRRYSITLGSSSPAARALVSIIKLVEGPAQQCPLPRR